ncbi:SIR2 family protein [Oricola thermophila]|uniref:SIR2 family protein n=1 Tax=Oricola thermophila TaxID=2742145 RepID=A0A6N1V896_9HYPH|nr:SIR2 family protein [Oricola thermophila]QKV17130.1 SIR2 family protein [Oricola thermophila]
MELDEAISQIKFGNCVLFTGSGFSLGAKSISGGDILNVSGLIERFLDISGVDENRSEYDLETAAQVACGADKQRVFSELMHSMRCREVSYDHRHIARINWRRVYTSNYDNVFEVASTSERKVYRSFTVLDRAHSPEPGGNEVVHIHGYIERLSSDNFDQEFYLTDDQSRNIRFINSSWNRKFLDDLTFSDAVFFIGFSNSDFHIRKLLDSVTNLKNKIFFIVQQNPSRPSIIRLQPYGEVCPIGLTEFANRVASIRPQRRSADSLVHDCFRKKVYERVNSEDHASREQVQQEVMLGTIDEAFFTKSILYDKNRGVYIDRVSRRFSDVLNLNPKCIVFYSDIGNGKTVIANHFCSLYQGRYANVFEYNGRSYSTSDVRRFCESVESSIFLIENVSKNINLLRIISDTNNGHIIVATDRTKRLEIDWHNVRDAVPSAIKFDVNILTSNEMELMVDFLDSNILWGDYTNLSSKQQKVDFIRNRCGAEIRGILFALFDGGSVRNRVDTLFSELDSLPKDYRDLLIIVCVLNFAYTRNNLDGYLYEYEDLLDLRVSLSDFSEKINNSSIGELLDRDRGCFKFKSSVFAKYMLNSKVDISYVLDLVYRALLNLERTYRHDDVYFYRDMSKALMQYNLYREIYTRNSAKDGRLKIAKKLFEKEIHSFYDRCRHLKIAHNDPLFVIQISMAQLDGEHFEECERLIESAEAMCDSNYDRYQIETHKAEVIAKRSLVRGISPGLVSELEAFSLLKSVVERRNERYHPFGVMDVLLHVFDKNINAIMVGDDCDKAAEMMVSMIDLTNRFPNELSERYHIIRIVNRHANGILKKIGYEL